MFYVKTHLLTLSTEKDDFDFCEETANLIKKHWLPVGSC